MKSTTLQVVGKVTRYRAEFIFIRLFRFDSFDIFPKKASHQWYESSISLRYKARPFGVFNHADVLEHSNIYIGNSFTSSRRFALCIPRKCASRFTTRKEVPARRSNGRAARWNQPCATAAGSISKQEISVHTRKRS